MQNFDIRENHDELDEQESSGSPTGEIRHGVSQVLRDIVTLGELQAELLQVDLRNLLAGRVIPTLTLALVAAVAALASLPILLASLAYYLVEVANLTLGSAFLASSAGRHRDHMLSIITWPKPEQLTWVAPSRRRAKS